MMRIEKNRELLMERYPGISFLLSCVPYEVKAFPKEGTFSKKIPWDEIEVLYIYGLRSFSFYEPVKKWLDAGEPRRVVLLEEDLGVIDALLTHEVALELLTHPRIHLHFVEEPKKWKNDLSALAAAHPTTRPFLCAPFKEARMRAHLMSETYAYQALFTDVLYSHRIYSNVRANMQHLPRAFYANAWKGEFKGVPSVICGAGPSLEGSIDALRTLENKALILAGGSTLTALSSHGIIPHLGCAFDPNLEEYERLKYSNTFEMPLIYGGRLCPRVFSTCSGPFGYLRSGTGGPYEAYLEERLGLSGEVLGPELGKEALSVTTLALAFALFLGCDPIIFVGVDLAFREGRSYAEGVIVKDSLIEERPIRRLGRHGRSVLTAPKWILEAKALSAYAKKHPGTTFIDSTEEGLSLPGIAYTPLHVAIETHCHNSIDLSCKIHELIQSHKMQVSAETMHDLQEEMHASIASVEKLYADSIVGSFSQALLEHELHQEVAWQQLFCYIEAALEMCPSFPSAQTKKEHLRHIAQMLLKP